MSSHVQHRLTNIYTPPPPSNGLELPGATDRDVSKQIWYRARSVDAATHADDSAGLNFQAAITVFYVR